MIRCIFCFAGLLFSYIYSFAQDPKEILKQAYQKCQSVQNGYYEMNKSKKGLNQKYSSQSSYYCHFKKLSTDSIYSSAFRYRVFTKSENEFPGIVIYTGDDFVRCFANDSSAIIMSKYKWAKEIKTYSSIYTFYSPLTNKSSLPLQHDSDYIDGRHIFKFVGLEMIKDIFCSHIEVDVIPQGMIKSTMKLVKQEYHYWINQKDSVPIKYSISQEFLMNKRTLKEFEIYALNKYELNTMKDDSILKLNSIPSFYNLKDFIPYKSAEPLPIDTIAPDWDLFSVNNERVTLKGLRGNLVLINFFSSSCYPCTQSLPFLQSLYMKFGGRGLKIIGIDPYDKRQDDIAAFLYKKGITYPVLLDGLNTAKEYHVSGTPTIYLIDGNGKIIFVKVGYGKDVDVILESEIQRHL